MNNQNRQFSADNTISLRKAAVYLGVSTGVMSRLCEQGEITHTRIGHKFRISILDLDLYRAEHTIEAKREGAAS